MAAATAAEGCQLWDAFCNAQNVADTIVDVGTEFVPQPVVAAAKALDFASNPPGWVLEQLANGIKFLSSVLIPFVLDALHPDFSADWFRSAYSVSFGVAALVMVILLLSLTAQRRRGDTSGLTLIDSFAKAMPAFLIGGAYGPALGFSINKLTSGLSDSLASWGVNSTTTDFYGKLGDRFASYDFIGSGVGWVLGLVLLLAMLGTLFGVVSMLIVQLAMLYLIGALIPLGWVWIIHPKTREFGMKAPLTFLAIAFSHVLLFLLLGIAYKTIGGLAGDWAESASDPKDVAKNVINMALIVVLMALAVFSPAALWRVGRSSNALGGAGTTKDGGINAPKPDDVPQPPSTARETASDSSGGGAGGSVPASGPAVASDAGTSASAASTSAASGAGMGSSIAGSGTAAAGGGAAAAGGTAAVGGTAAAGGAASGAAAGAAVSATGVGAAVGIPMMLAAGARAVAAGFQHVQTAADQVGEAADERD
jgi:type IV secretion system protein TrbL